MLGLPLKLKWNYKRRRYLEIQNQFTELFFYINEIDLLDYVSVTAVCQSFVRSLWYSTFRSVIDYYALNTECISKVLAFEQYDFKFLCGQIRWNRVVQYYPYAYAFAQCGWSVTLKIIKLNETIFFSFFFKV